MIKHLKYLYEGIFVKRLKTVIFLIFFVFVFHSCSKDGGVKLANEMEPYAIQYLKEHKILKENEKVVAYYDYTLILDGTEAAILTLDRIIYHNNNNSLSINIKDIVDIKHREETMIGDIIEIYGRDGEIMKIEIAPLNQGKTFYNVLNAAYKRKNIKK